MSAQTKKKDDGILRAQLPEYAAPLWRPRRYKVLYGGRGAARSWTFARMALLVAAQRKARFLCCREIQRTIRESVHKLLSDQIEIMGLPGFRVFDNEIRNEATGSTFAFEGLRHNIIGLKSYEGIDIAWIEEAEKVSKDSWDILIPTIRRPGSEIWVNFNPDQEDDPTYQRFVTSPPPDALCLFVSWEDNPWFPDELRTEKDYLYRVDPGAAEHVWGGATRVNTEAQVLHGKWRVESFEPKEDWDGPYLGADWGFAVSPTTLVKVWIKGLSLMIEWEAYGVGVDIGLKTSQLFERIPFARDYLIRADSARPETISNMKNGDPKSDSPWNGWKVVAASKWAGSVKDGIQHLRKFEEIIIHPRCIHAIEEARLYSYKVDRLTGDVLPDIVDKHDHIWDAVRYALSPLIRRRSWGPAI